jgi:hypothetical protein
MTDRNTGRRRRARDREGWRCSSKGARAQKGLLCRTWMGGWLISTLYVVRNFSISGESFERMINERY